MANLKALGHRLIWTVTGAWTREDDNRRTRSAATAEAIRRLALSEYEQRMIRPSSQLAQDTYRRRNDSVSFEHRALSDADAAIVGEAIGEQARALGYRLLALAVGPECVQLVMRHHRDRPEDSIEQLKHAARMKLHARDAGWVGHPVWAAGGWAIPLERRAQLTDAVQTVTTEAEQFEQHWPFV
jgi:hypothetical protein